MDSEFNPIISTVSQSHPETMDFLSPAWCNFAVQAFQPEVKDRSLFPVQEDSLKNIASSFMKMENSVKMDDAEKSFPSWKSNDIKSWIWVQQAMHPELNYHSYFRKKWLSWKIGVPFRHVSIKKWLKEMKQKRKEDQRLQKAEVHAAMSVAGLAAALAAITAEDSKSGAASCTTKESAVASAAALVAAQCAQVAEAMGAKKEQLSSVISSAMSGTNASDILTLTAAAATSLKGAETLKARSGCKNRLNGNAPVLPIEENSDCDTSDFEKCRSILANGSELRIQTPNGRCRVRSVSVFLDNEAKVILKIRKFNLLNVIASKQESIISDLHAELYKDSEAEEINTCYLIVLTTNHGMMKLDMMDDFQRYKLWAGTISHMLMLSTSFTRCELQFYKS